MSGAGDTRQLRLHPPDAVVVDGALDPDTRRALEEVLLRAVGSALARLRPPELRIDGAAGRATAPGAEPWATPAEAAARTTELPVVAGATEVVPQPPVPQPPVPQPSARRSATGGLLLAMALPADLVEGTEEPPAAGATPEPAPEPAPVPGPLPAQQPAGEDRVVDGPSPVDGRVVMMLFLGGTVTLGGAGRHVRASNIVRAVDLGLGVFGTTSFAVLYGPVGEPDSGFRVVATTPTVEDRRLHEAAARFAAGGKEKVVTLEGGELLKNVVDDAGHRYQVVSVMSKERNHLIPKGVDVEERIRLLRARAPELPKEEFRRLVFADIDRLLGPALAGDGDRLQEAADRLARLDRVAFAQVDWETRTRYLEVLIRAWTHEQHELAIVELMCSLDSVTQLHAVLEKLAAAHLVEQLYGDLGENLWTLLTGVGRRFGSTDPFTFGTFLTLVRDAFGLSPKVRESIAASVAGGVVHLGWSVLAEIEEAVLAVWDFLVGLVKGLGFLLTRPLDVVAGLGQLVRLEVTFELAAAGYPPAWAEAAAVLKNLGGALLVGLKGVAVLQEGAQQTSTPSLGETVLRKIRWAVVIEIASWFVGLGELKSAATAVGLTEKVSAALRFLGLLGKLADAAEAERITVGLSRVAKAMRGGSGALRQLRSDAEVVRLLSELPEADAVRLGELLERVEVAEGSTLAELTAHPELGAAVGESFTKVETLQRLAAKSGGFSEELGVVFRRLAGPDGFSQAELTKLAKELAPGEGRRLLAVVEHIGLQRIGAEAEVGAEFLTLLAAEPRRMAAVREVGHEVLRLLFERTGGKAEPFDAMVAELARLKDVARKEEKLGEFAGLLDRLAAGDAEAWAGLLRRGAAPADREQVLARIDRLWRRYQRQAANRDALQRQVRRLRKLAEKDPESALEQLEAFESKLPAGAGGSSVEAEVAADVEEAGKRAGHDEKALHHEPGEAPPEAPTEYDKPHKPTGRDRASADLADAMAEAGEPCPPGHDTHHIVADADPRAELARQILKRNGIEPRNSPLNGVHLPRTSMDPKTVAEAATRHQTVHTDAYHRELTRRLLEAEHDGDVHRVLAELKDELKRRGSFEALAGAEPGESFADWLQRHRGEVEWLKDEDFEEVVQASRRAARKEAGEAAKEAARRRAARKALKEAERRWAAERKEAARKAAAARPPAPAAPKPPTGPPDRPPGAPDDPTRGK
ncbi:AHH domain-containing protein [Kitasatospora sp. NPDC094028]